MFIRKLNIILELLGLALTDDNVSMVSMAIHVAALECRMSIYAMEDAVIKGLLGKAKIEQ